ncbi:MAG TPA: ABC transporter permease, partial [Bryobacteraceae bacterium]|nr:ABC transporter permease [Bryobacteraceae bacterium]
RPLRFPEPERLVQIQESPPSGGYTSVSYPNFVDWEKQSRSFESMGMAAVFPETLKGTGGNQRIQAAYVSPRFHQAYGVKPMIGRSLTADDDRAGAPPVVLLSRRFWQSHYGGDPGVLGRTLPLGDRVWTIAGVMPVFRWQRYADVFVPIAFAQDKWTLNLRENRSSSGVIARLKPGVTVEQARAEMKLIAAQLAKQYPGANGGISAVVVPLREYIGGGIRQAVLLAFGAVGLLLLIACANVAGLQLARAAAGRQEMAIRLALGASRLQLIRQLLTESLLLALTGAAAGVAVAWAGVTWLQRNFPAAENLGGIGLDARVLAFAVLAAAATAVLCGLAPALQFTRPSMVDAIKGGGRGSRSQVRLRTRRLLVVGQVALAAVLSTGTGLLMRSLVAALDTDTGFRPEQVVMAPILPADRADADLSRNARLLREVVERLAGVPGVEAAGAVDALPFSNPDSSASFYRDDRPVPEPGQVPMALKAAATPGYFRAMGIPLVRGRLFDPSDGQMGSVKRDMPSLLAYMRSVELAAVINETMARRFWPGEDPVGKFFRWGPPTIRGPRVKIVGVVGDTRQYGLDRPVEPQYFFSSDQFPVWEARLVVRTSGDDAGLAATMRAAVAECDPDAVVTSVESMDSVIDRTLAGRQNNALLLGLFSGIALLLAALGLYATMAYMVAQRTQEIGVRMALGAAATDVRLMVVREGAILAGAGVILGVLAALAGARVVSSMLYGVTATDALSYTASAGLLVAVMLLASYIPARRASRVDPLVALRLE